MTRRPLIALTAAALLIGPAALPLAGPAQAGTFRCEAALMNVTLYAEAEELGLKLDPGGAAFSHDPGTWSAYMDRSRWLLARGACAGDPRLATVSAAAARQKLAAVIVADRGACAALGHRVASNSYALREAVKSEPLSGSAVISLQATHELDQDYGTLCPGDPGLAAAEEALLQYDVMVRKIAAAKDPADETVMPMLSAIGPQTAGLVCRVTLHGQLPVLKSQQATLGAQDRAACATAAPAAKAILGACADNTAVMGKLGANLQKVGAFCGA